MKEDKLFNKIKNNPNNIKFKEVETLLKHYKFKLERQKGSHQIYKKGNILVNIQKRKNPALKGEVSSQRGKFIQPVAFHPRAETRGISSLGGSAFGGQGDFLIKGEVKPYQVKQVILAIEESLGGV